MDKNNQNKSQIDRSLRILLNPVGAPPVEPAVLTISEEMLLRLGLQDYEIKGVKQSVGEYAGCFGLFAYEDVKAILEKIKIILRAVIVNTQQRESVETLIYEAVHDIWRPKLDYVMNQMRDVEEKPTSEANDSGLNIKKHDRLLNL